METKNAPLILEGNPVQNVSTVIDTINNCNLGCGYCHPMEDGKWGGEMLSAKQIGDVLRTSDEMGGFETLLTGGEVTIHPEFADIMARTRDVDRTAVAMVTNAIRLTSDKIASIRESGIDRVCVSVDGPEASLHDHRRGRGSFAKAMNGLHALQDTGKSITVISVLDRRTYRRIPELSEMLADEGLANQHHVTAPCYSGKARRSYDQYALKDDDYYAVQGLVDASYADFLARGLYVTFNSFWPATGKHAASEEPRTLTLSQMRERTKGLYTVVRSNGDVRTTAAAWGRETVGDAVMGNLNNETAGVLLRRVDDAYQSGEMRQLPREVEAANKFQMGPVIGEVATDVLLNNRDAPLEAQPDLAVATQPVRPLSGLDMLDNPLSSRDIANLARRIAENPGPWRLVTHASGVDLAFNRATSHTTMLKPAETAALLQELQTT